MSREPFKVQAHDSSFARFFYGQVILRDHFLVRLREVIPCRRFTCKLVR